MRIIVASAMADGYYDRCFQLEQIEKRYLSHLQAVREVNMRIAVILVLLVVCGCSTFRFPGVFKITIQQGNVISQTMIDKLKPGMTKNQVKFVMGNAVVNNTLNADRWDYVYSAQFRDADLIRRRLSLFFTNDRLTHFEGDYRPSSEQEKDDQT
jgi:outer membrane protein assembly factor BamE